MIEFFSFCKIDNLADVAIFIFLPLFWAFVCFCIRKISPRKKLWLAVALIYPVLFLAGSMISHTMFTQSLLFIWWVLVPIFIGIILGHLNVDSTQWLPLNTEKASTAVKSLKNAIEKYEQEYRSDHVNDGYSVRVSLKDYKRKTSRRLNLSNASILGMQGAMAIEKMMFDLMPPREIFTTLSYDEVAEKCNEPRNAFADSVMLDRQNNTDLEQVKDSKQKDSLELNNSEEK